MYVNHQSIGSELENNTYTAEVFTEILEHLNDVGIEVNHDFKTFKMIARTGQNGVKEALAEKIEPQEIAGIMQSPRKIVDTLDLPDLSHFDKIRDNLNPRFIADSSEHLIFAPDAVVFTEEERNNIRDKYTYYATTEHEKDFMQKAKAAAEAMEALSEATDGYIGRETLMRRVFLIGRDSGKFKVSEEFVKNTIHNRK